ncbi:MAG: hypothetical protein HC904_16640 [Blastochloris sp.]|nr:hypothetical protein [Blastochloris sp.]
MLRSQLRAAKEGVVAVVDQALVELSANHNVPDGVNNLRIRLLQTTQKLRLRLIEIGGIPAQLSLLADFFVKGSLTRKYKVLLKVVGEESIDSDLAQVKESVIGSLRQMQSMLDALEALAKSKIGPLPVKPQKVIQDGIVQTRKVLDDCIDKIKKTNATQTQVEEALKHAFGNLTSATKTEIEDLRSLLSFFAEEKINLLTKLVTELDSLEGILESVSKEALAQSIAERLKQFSRKSLTLVEAMFREAETKLDSFVGGIINKLIEKAGDIKVRIEGELDSAISKLTEAKDLETARANLTALEQGLRSISAEIRGLIPVSVHEDIWKKPAYLQPLQLRRAWGQVPVVPGLTFDGIPTYNKDIPLLDVAYRFLDNQGKAFKAVAMTPVTALVDSVAKEADDLAKKLTTDLKPLGFAFPPTPFWSRLFRILNPQSFQTVFLTWADSNWIPCFPAFPCRLDSRTWSRSPTVLTAHAA